MSRLIDADATMEMDNETAMKHLENGCDYNLNKVVEQLKGLHEGYKCTDNEFQRGAKAGAHYVLNRAIEIVKGGGVNA